MKRFFLIFSAALCLAASCEKAVPPCFVYVETLQPIGEEYVCKFNSIYKPAFVASDGRAVLPVDGKRNYLRIEYLDDTRDHFCYAAMSAEKYGIDGWYYAFGALAATEPGQRGSIRLSYDDGTIQFEKTLNLIADPEYPTAVDLGLSVKWAQHNLGATKADEYGLYYQWGNTQGYGSDVSDGKYFYWTENKEEMNMEDDVAKAALGGSWRVPTDVEWAELYSSSNCSWIWMDVNGVSGYKVQSKKTGYSDNWIFLPAAGERESDELNKTGNYGCYWSSALVPNYPKYAICTSFDSHSVYTFATEYRCYGHSIRPVCE